MVVAPGIAGRLYKSPLHFATLGFGQLQLTNKSTQPQAKRHVPRCRLGDGKKKNSGRIGEELNEWGWILGALTTSATCQPMGAVSLQHDEDCPEIPVFAPNGVERRILTAGGQCVEEGVNILRRSQPYFTHCDPVPRRIGRGARRVSDAKRPVRVVNLTLNVEPREGVGGWQHAFPTWIVSLSWRRPL